MPGRQAISSPTLSRLINCGILSQAVQKISARRLKNEKLGILEWLAGAGLRFHAAMIYCNKSSSDCTWDCIFRKIGWARTSALSSVWPMFFFSSRATAAMMSPL